ncbi:Uncharacterized protein FWK35_00032186 [Aphis craccivora]|uniref:Uncharacterized protein n=1 Tax=Aphis craccivora TaxID=307492 RepID=A0A6G0W0B3_APHCR|nr:Uncharacterized protein FWK35_00032186 [Aphis craccivora]
MKVILKDLRNAAKIIDNYEKNLNNSNVTTHNVNSMAVIKIVSDFIYSTLEKVFDKGAAKSNSINGTQNHQIINNASNRSQIQQTTNKTYNITIVNSKNKTTQMKSKLRRLNNSTHERWHSFVEEPKTR